MDDDLAVAVDDEGFAGVQHDVAQVAILGDPEDTVGAGDARAARVDEHGLAAGGQRKPVGGKGLEHGGLLSY